MSSPPFSTDDLRSQEGSKAYQFHEVGSFKYKFRSQDFKDHYPKDITICLLTLQSITPRNTPQYFIFTLGKNQLPSMLWKKNWNSLLLSRRTMQDTVWFAAILIKLFSFEVSDTSWTLWEKKSHIHGCRHHHRTFTHFVFIVFTTELGHFACPQAPKARPLI